jgi:hypothetical protein
MCSAPAPQFERSFEYFLDLDLDVDLEADQVLPGLLVCRVA